MHHQGKAPSEGLAAQCRKSHPAKTVGESPERGDLSAARTHRSQVSARAVRNAVLVQSQRMHAPGLEHDGSRVDKGNAQSPGGDTHVTQSSRGEKIVPRRTSPLQQDFCIRLHVPYDARHPVRTHAVCLVSRSDTWDFCLCKSFGQGGCRWLQRDLELLHWAL
jgi:hypothetical protein